MNIISSSSSSDNSLSKSSPLLSSNSLSKTSPNLSSNSLSKTSATLLSKTSPTLITSSLLSYHSSITQRLLKHTNTSYFLYESLLIVINKNFTTKLLQNIGFTLNKQIYLFIEEALYCIEKGFLDIYYENKQNEISLSLNECYGLLEYYGNKNINNDMKFGDINATSTLIYDICIGYRYLRSLGYIVLRSQLYTSTKLDFIFSPNEPSKLSRPSFYVWPPSENFAKTKPSIPLFKYFIYSVNEKIPTLEEYLYEQSLENCTIRYLLVDGNHCRVIQFNQWKLDLTREKDTRKLETISRNGNVKYVCKNDHYLEDY